MSDDPRPPLTTTTSLWPALTVLAIAVVMLAVFMVIDLVTNHGVVSAPTTTLPTVVGGLARDPSPGPALYYCRQTQEVPSDVADAFVFPVDTSSRPGANTPNLGAGDFDCYEPMTTAHANSSSLLAFFGAQLGARGWGLFSHGAANGDPQSLFQKASSDGFYWVVGVTVTASTSSSVRWTFRVYQNSQTI